MYSDINKSLKMFSLIRKMLTSRSLYNLKYINWILTFYIKSHDYGYVKIHLFKGFYLSLSLYFSLSLSLSFYLTIYIHTYKENLRVRFLMYKMQ